MTRERLTPTNGGGAYFAPPSSVQTFSTGCALLNCVLGGGYPVGRIINIVGDKSTGKTLLAIEACANFALTYPKGVIRYNEVEAAFDIPYAQALGLPTDRVQFATNCLTVEDLFADMKAFLLTLKGKPGFYIVDSLDALSDKGELKREFGEGSFGTAKAKLLGQLFRQIVQELQSKQTTVLIISQVRDNVGVTFGETNTRSGGRALDFYASQVLWLAHTGKLKSTRMGVERVTGVSIKALCKKNKIGLPFRDCSFEILFGFGVNDVKAGIDWLIATGKTAHISLTKEDALTLVKRLNKLPNAEYNDTRVVVADAIRTAWSEVEAAHTPPRRKY